MCCNITADILQTDIGWILNCKVAAFKEALAVAKTLTRLSNFFISQAHHKKSEQTHWAVLQQWVYDYKQRKSNNNFKMSEAAF